MPTTRITDKLSKVVNWQLPEHIRSDYPLFVAFLEYYYQYIEQDQYAQELIQNARSYADVDRTASSFISYFLKNYAKDIPTGILANKPLLIKRISDLYESKGSALSFKLLFNLLYQTDIELKYPYENVLRASDGTWQQLVSIRVTTITGDRAKINGHVLYFEKNNQTYEIPIVKVAFLTSTITEIYLDPNNTAVINNLIEGGDEVYTSEAGVEVFRGEVGYTTTGSSILNGGLNFKVGQIFKVNYEGAVNSLFKVTNVTAQGAITEIKFVNYGYNFTSNLTINFNAASVVGSVSDEYYTTSNGFSESGVVLIDGDYFSETYAIDPTYVMTIAETFSNVYAVAGGTTTGAIDEAIASITFTVGALGRYPGTFTTNKGFLSDIDIRLQNNLLYQPFAYQLNTELDINEFYDTVIKTVHPAGQNLFNNRVISNQLNVSSNVSLVFASNVYNEVYDSIQTTDALLGFTLSKPVSDSATISENFAYSLSKETTDLANITETLSLEINTEISDTQSLNDATEILLNLSNVLDSFAVTDTANISTSLGINNNDSVVSFTETLFSTTLNYAEYGYFAETYAGETTQLV